MDRKRIVVGRMLIAGALVLGAIGVGCSSRSDENGEQPSADVGREEPTSREEPTTSAEADGFTLTSTAFEAGARMPKKYTADGENVSPPLAWSGVPEKTKELALICDDPNAPRSEPWVHWVLYKIPANARGLPEGVPHDERLADPAKALQGKTTWGTTGYRGPSPPTGRGTHHYHFKLYSLDADLDIPPGLAKDKLLKAIEGHVLAQTELIGTYSR